MDHDIAGRTLRLLTLLQTRPTWAAADLASRLEVPPRTLRRDLQRLISLGYQVDSKPGPGGHYRLAAGARLPPLVFDDDEVVALIAGLRAVEQGAAAEAASRAIAKLRQVLPPRLASLAADVADATESLHLDPPGELVHEDVLGPLTTAGAADLVATFDYTDRHHVASQRRVDSIRCLLSRGHWYLLAFDLDRADWRVFRLDRIQQVAAKHPAPRRNPPADDLATWMLTDFGRLDQPPHT